MKTVIAAIAALVLIAAQADAARAVDTSDPIAVKLMAQCKAASGGAALDRPTAFHETGTIVRDGHAGTYEMYADLHALRTAGIHTLDGKIGGGGYDGTSAWHFGPDGKVIVSTDPAELAEQRSGAYFTIGGYFYPDRFPATFKYLGRKKAGSKLFDVIAVAPEGAMPANLWLDVRSHRLVMATGESGDTKFEIDILDYRVVDGAWIGFKNRQLEGTHTMVQTLATLDYVPLDPARFLPPKFGP